MSSSKGRDRDKVQLVNYFHSHKSKLDDSSSHKSSRSDYRDSPSSSKSSRKEHYHSDSPDDKRDRSGSRHKRESRSPSHRRREKHRSRSRSRSRSPKSSRHYRSPPRWSERKAEDRRARKLCVLEKLGIDLKQLDTKSKETSSSTIPGLEGAIVRLPNQGQKKKLLWGSSTSKDEGKEKEDTSKVKPSVWESARFSEDQDGRMTAKFQRLMGIKKEDSENKPNESKPINKDLLKKQEELFSSMELQYEAARQATHTQRGVGLGFGRF